MDSGNFSDNPTPAGDAKTGTLIEAMGLLGYAAANVGERDLKGGYEQLVRRTADATFPLLSSNILRSDTQAPVFRPYTVAEVASPDGSQRLRVGLIGVARFNPLFRKPGPEGSELTIVHPAEPIRRSVTELRAQGVELIVLLAALHRDDARRLLEEVSGIDFVVGSYGGIVSTSRNPASGAWLLYSGNQGKRLGECRIYLRDDGSMADPVHQLHYLTPRYPADPTMMEFLNSAAPPPAAAASRPEGAATESDFVGATACRTCHASVYAQWAGTPHATAFATLEREGNHEKPECVRCHTTAPGKGGGFVSLRETPQMAHVGCETCHGSGRAHTRSPDTPYGKVEIASCTECHDLENSPDFDYYTYRQRVAHSDRKPR